MPYFSVIVPVYNRREEVKDLLESLSQQSNKDFEVIIVEDGSTEPCEDVVHGYKDLIAIKYFHKSNEGRSIARNFGIGQAQGSYCVFFDSDCIIPPGYFKVLAKELNDDYTDCFGGPDAAHESFSNIQKAINYSMTSFLTTGGIRGGKIKLDKFVPRSFNMGYSKEVWRKVGGFREMFSEDIDMSTRIKQAGYSIKLIRDAYVYHKRRVNLRLFLRQIYVFGMSRITLYLLYPDSLKAVHLLPSLFTIASAIMIILSVFWRWWVILPLTAYTIALYISAFTQTKNYKISALAILTSFIQLWGYGSGFLYAFIRKIILGKGRDIEEEIKIRKGK